MERLPVLEISFQSNLINLFLGFTENNGTSMSSTIHVYEVSYNGVSMVVRAIQGQMLNGL